MPLSQSEFENLLHRLQREKTESPTVEAKKVLPLNTEGDKAEFIRHVAALANNVDPSYLIVGIEDKTWAPIGLEADSPLVHADKTQRRLTQVLENRIDPTVSIRYGTYDVDGHTYGLVTLKGTKAPYVISIEDQRYGGRRTQARPSYVYRGAVYVRHGANSVVANRQRDILDVAEQARQIDTKDAEPDPFLAAHNYLDVQSEDFGEHSLSRRLVEVKAEREKWGGEYSRARSWVALVFRPLEQRCEIDTVALKAKLKPDQRVGRGSEWYRGLPKPFGRILYNPRSSNPRQYIAIAEVDDGESGIDHFLRIQSSGHIEVGCSYPLFVQYSSTRSFNFEAIIGYLWQLTYLSRAIYRDAEYNGAIELRVNLVGTTGTRMSGFAPGWMPAHSPLYHKSADEVPIDRNIQVRREILLAMVNGDQIEETVRGVASDLAAYYGQDRPRCFEYQSGEFPSKRYVRRWN